MPFKHPRSRNWYITWTEGGRQRTRSSGTTDYQEAKRLENRRRGDAQYRKAYQARSLNEILAQYLTDRPTERAAYAAKRLLEAWDEVTIDALTPEALTDYKRARSITDGTLRRELGVLRAAIRHCNKHLGWDLPDVTVGLVPKEPRHRIRWITREEADLLIGSTDDKAPWLADIIALALHTGLRKQELLGLTWRRVDLVNRMIRFEPDDHKSKTYASVPLNQTARDLLKRRLSGADGEYVFHRGGRRIRDIKRSFATACRVAGIQDFTPHDLRHTCASWLVQAGVPIVMVKEIMRHSDIKTTMRYAHLAPHDLAGGLELLDRSSKSTVVEGVQESGTVHN